MEERQARSKDCLRETIITHRGEQELGTKLKQIAEKARSNPQERFTSLIHLINEEMLTTSFYEIKAGKATGVDKVTKEMYQEHLCSFAR